MLLEFRVGSLFLDSAVSNCKNGKKGKKALTNSLGQAETRTGTMM